MDRFTARAGFPAGADLRWVLAEMRPRALRKMGKFAESEIRIPDGPFLGLRYRCDRQPYSRLFFEAVDSGVYREYIAVGPTQSGKTLTCFVIPAMYHLFEVGETVICVVPDESMVNDKWTQDLLPVIKASKFAKYLPTKGQGSRGGRVTDSVTFTNGVTLKFMTAGGGDTNRAAFTARVLILTEMNKFGERKASSAESDMYRQLKGRLRAFGDQALIYGECTVTNEAGLVWSEYSNGTASALACPCGHCGDYVTPGREHLVGWEDAKTAMEAAQLARWACPSCGVLWGDGEREKFVKGSILIHEGQTVKVVKRGYKIMGDAPDTWTLGFRWSAVDNLFLKTGYIGAGEWTARNLAENEINAEIEQLQFVWAMPVPDGSDKSIALRPDALAHRQGRFGKGVVPPGAGLVAFMDLGKYKCHWGVAAAVDTSEGLRYWLVDAGMIRTEMDHLSERDAMLVAMREFHERCEEGFLDDATGEVIQPTLRYIDSGKWADIVYDFIIEMAAAGHGGYFPTKGFGVSQDQARVYTEPSKVTDRVVLVGDRYHLALQEAKGVVLIHIDVDAWKSRVHAALRAPIGETGSLVLWKGDWKKHMPVARHLLSEVAIEEFVPGKGTVVRWEKISRDNHWFDCVVGAFAGLDYLGALMEAKRHGAEQKARKGQEGGGEGGENRGLEGVSFGGALSRDR